jgi:hypothetical protein
LRRTLAFYVSFWGIIIFSKEKSRAPGIFLAKRYLAHVIFQRFSFFEHNLRSTPLFMLSSQPEKHQMQIQIHSWNISVMFFSSKTSQNVTSDF